MFEKYGEFDSYEEINRAAAAQLAEGDEEAIYAIAEENGIDREDAEDYIAGDASELVTALMAANGKLKVEAAELQPKEIMADWLDYIQIQCFEDQEMRLAVRRKGKEPERVHREAREVVIRPCRERGQGYHQGSRTSLVGAEWL